MVSISPRFHFLGHEFNSHFPRSNSWFWTARVCVFIVMISTHAFLKSNSLGGLQSCRLPLRPLQPLFVSLRIDTNICHATHARMKLPRTEWPPSQFGAAPASEHPWPPAAAAAAELRQATEIINAWGPSAFGAALASELAHDRRRSSACSCSNTGHDGK